MGKLTQRLHHLHRSPKIANVSTSSLVQRIPKEIGVDDVGVAGAGLGVGAGTGIAIGHMGAAGLAAGGTAFAIPAALVIGVPAVGVAAVAFTGYKVFKAIRRRKARSRR